MRFGLLRFLKVLYRMAWKYSEHMNFSQLHAIALHG